MRHNDRHQISIRAVRDMLRPYGSIIYFAVILLGAHFFWKFFVAGDESNDQVTLFGLDISRPFVFMAQHIAEYTYLALEWMGYDVTLTSNNIISHNLSKSAVWIVWGCTGIKQAYIFFCIIACYRGAWKHKLWYIPAGLFVVYLFNLFRIILITAIIDKHPESFDLWHEHIMKYAFYGLIFVLWVIWNELFAESSKKATRR